MGNLTVQTEEREGPLHSHYVSRANDGIYPAMSSPLGYEDQHPEDYRPATAREVQKYQGGQESVTVRALPPAGAAPQELVPSSIQLLDDEPDATDEVGPPVIVTPTTAQTAPAPLAADVGQPAPAPVVEALPITPAPVAAIPVAAPAPAPLTPAPVITPATDAQPE